MPTKSQVNIKRLKDLYTERLQLRAYSSTHSQTEIFTALDPIEREIKDLEAVTRAMITGMLKDGYSVRQVSDQLVYSGLEQYEADVLVSEVRRSFAKVANELQRA